MSDEITHRYLGTWAVVDKKRVRFLWFFWRKIEIKHETSDLGATWREVGTGYLVKPGTEKYNELREALASYRIKVAPEPALPEVANG